MMRRMRRRARTMADRTSLDRVEAGDNDIAHAGDYPQGSETDLTDLLGDLMHWAQARDLDWEACISQARRHFEAEDDGTDVPTMSDTAYGKVFGTKALRRRRARRSGAGVSKDTQRCTWCNA